MLRIMLQAPTLTTLGAFLLFTPGLWAQVEDPSGQAETFQKLMARIDRLEKRVAELEAVQLPVTPPVSAARLTDPQAESKTLSPGVRTAVPGTHDHGTLMEAVATYPSLKVSGFGDINFSANDQHGSHSGFNEGQFILHLSSALSPRVTYFGELSLTARTDAGVGSPSAPGFNFELERNLIRFDRSDHLKLSFGRYHTPISYWNTEFHHGSWLQTTAIRPEMIQFGTSFMPVHFVGALAEGSFTARGLNLNYNVGVGNGRSSVLSRDGDWGDVNNNRAWLATVYVKPDRFYGLQMGASVYRDKINATARPETREWIQSAHVVWSKERPEFIAEFFNIRHQQPGSSLVNNQAWYAQFAYRLPFADQWKPYYRYEYIHVPLADAVFRGLVSNLSSSTAGVRYDASSFAAFKFEYRNQARPGQRTINVAWAQTSFTF